LGRKRPSGPGAAREKALLLEEVSEQGWRMMEQGGEWWDPGGEGGKGEKPSIY